MGAFSELAIDDMEQDNIPTSFLEDEAPQVSMTTLSQGQDTKANTGTAPKTTESSEAEKKAEPKTDPSEDTRRKAHEEAEAKRKAEWEARQLAKKQAEEAAIQKLRAMSDDEVMAASTQRVSTDTEKLTRRNMKECVAEHIQTLCLEDPAFARLTMHPRKSMIRCFQYISRKAWEYVQDELKANGIKPGPGQQGYGCDVPDDLCYQWAVDYFKDPDVKEDHEDDEEFVPRTYYGGSRSTGSTKKKEKKTGQSKAAAKNPEKKNDSSQITLGGFTMPEEKAG